MKRFTALVLILGICLLSKAQDIVNSPFGKLTIQQGNCDQFGLTDPSVSAAGQVRVSYPVQENNIDSIKETDSTLSFVVRIRHSALHDPNFSYHFHVDSSRILRVEVIDGTYSVGQSDYYKYESILFRKNDRYASTGITGIGFAKQLAFVALPAKEVVYSWPVQAVNLDRYGLHCEYYDHSRKMAEYSHAREIPIDLIEETDSTLSFRCWVGDDALHFLPSFNLSLAVDSLNVIRIAVQMGPHDYGQSSFTNFFTIRLRKTTLYKSGSIKGIGFAGSSDYVTLPARKK